MKFETILKHCSEVLEIAMKSHNPTDEILTSYFRKMKYIGSNERKLISEIIFLHLRFLGFSKYLINRLKENSQDSKLEESLLELLVTLLINVELYPNNLFSISKTIEKFYSFKNGYSFLLNYIIDQIPSNFNYLKEKINEINSSSSKLINYTHPKNIIKQDMLRIGSIRFSIPEFIITSWLDYYPQLEVNPFKLAESLLYPSYLTIRVNKIGIPREKGIDLLQREGYETIPTMYSPYGIILNERVNLFHTALYKNGIIEIQDEGSQLICLACSPKPKDKILDACAGAGGKSLFFALLQQDRGEIIANDIAYKKLIELRKRTHRSGFRSIKTHFLSERKSNRSNLLREGYFDIVLVDAPCSGIGTSRRNPIHKWWLTKEKLLRLQKKQIELLSFYSKYVRIGGTLVYSTCSLMPEENIQVIEKFLENHKNFQPANLTKSFELQGIKLPNLQKVSYHITILPLIHKTDGFFIAKLCRIL